MDEELGLSWYNPYYLLDGNYNKWPIKARSLPEAERLASEVANRTGQWVDVRDQGGTVVTVFPVG